jgi:uncharacterized protein
MRFVVFFLIVSTALALAYAYVGWRIIVPAGLSRSWAAAAWGLLLVLFLLPIVTVAVQFNRILPGTGGLLVWIGYITLGLFSFVFTFLVLRDLAWLLYAGGEKAWGLIGRIGGARPDPASLVDAQRRAVLVQGTNLAIIALAAGLTGYGVFQARRRPAVVEVNVPIDDLPEDLDGFRIVQLTDIHAGLTVTREFVQTVVDMANELRGDLVAFTGDLVDGTIDELRPHVAPMSALRSTHGAFFVTGNHEYYSGAEAWIEEARRIGFDVLVNEHRIISHNGRSILLAGVTDTSGGQFIPHHASDPHKAIGGAPPADVKILLAHQPRSLHEAVKAGFDLQISGHTHGGQFFPWNLAAAIGQPFIEGLHRLERTWVYVSKGTGYWGPPVRVGTRSEITVITLRRGT